MIIVTVRKWTDEAVMREACADTMHGNSPVSRATLRRMYRCEHSPIRTQMFYIRLQDVMTFVSTHLARHKFGIEHFIMTNRDDRGAGDAVITRNTPIRHGMWVNAAELIAIARKRLCYASHVSTVAAMRRIRTAVGEADPDLKDFMVPECVYRGFCPEARQCKPGVVKVVSAYAKEDTSPYKFRMKQLEGMEDALLSR